VQFYAPNIANGSVISVQIAGDPLLYTNACRKWRLGLFGGSNGYPKCGTYDDNRIWLSGVIGNRVDSSKSGAFRNGALVLDMAPTAPDGTVTDAHAISATFTAPDVNAIFWMEPDQQGILCGTQAGEWLVGPAAPGALSPLNIKARASPRSAAPTSCRAAPTTRWCSCSATCRRSRSISPTFTPASSPRRT
jgi:hypothetical protein